MATLRRRWLEAAWALFAAVNAIVIVVVPTGETIPFHVIWVSVTLVYSWRVWSAMATALTTACLCVVTGVALGYVVIGHPQGWDEMTEVPLMATIFLLVAWHARRHRDALEQVSLAAERERDFVRDASHILRTPITIAQGHTELIARECHGTPAGADAEIVLDELKRLTTISERLLLLASAQNPHLHTFELIAVETLLRKTVDRWTPTATRDWRLTVRQTATILGDEERLRAALDALIENALNATQDGDVIALSASTEAGTAVLEVSDSGVGIAAQDIERIFDRYSRPHPERNGSLGLGLAIVTAIVEAHNGSVTATSDPGKSTTFRIRIPAVNHSERDATALLRLPSAAEPAAADAGRAQEPAVRAQA